MRFLDHAIYLQRDGLKPASGLDEAGTMDAMGLGWVMMKPEGNRPLILQKTGGLQGMFSYIAFSPGRNIGAFAAINKFDVGGFDFLVEIGERADRGADATLIAAQPPHARR